MLTAQEVYTAARTLSLPERLRLAALILDELDQASPPSIDPTILAGYGDVWTDEDINDLRRYSAHYANSLDICAEQDDTLPPLEELQRLNREQSLEPEHL